MRRLSILAILGVLASACGGGGGGSSGGSGSIPPPTPAPTVTLSSSATSIAAGSSVTLTWSSQNATGCTASGNWSGAKALSGSETVGITASSTFGLTCTGTGGSGQSSVNISVAPAATATLTTSANVVPKGEAVTLTWSSQNATGCTASGGWSGTKATSGTEQVTVTASATYSIACTGTGGTGNASVAITAATPLSGVLTAKTYSVEEGPYVLEGRADVAPNTTVVFPAGTQLDGQGNTLRVFGTLSVLGESNRRSRLENVRIAPYSQIASDRYRIELSWCDMQGGSFFYPEGEAIYGSFSVTDCRLANLPYMYIWYPVGPSEFLRNEFIDSEPIGILLDGRNSAGERLTITHNKFSGYKPSTYSPLTAIEIIEVYNPANLTIQGNSFLDVGKVSIRLKVGGYTRRMITATGNYWGTDSFATIENMVFDERDDLAAPGIITFDPFLTSPPSAIDTSAAIIGDATSIIFTNEKTTFEQNEEAIDRAMAAGGSFQSGNHIIEYKANVLKHVNASFDGQAARIVNLSRLQSLQRAVIMQFVNKMRDDWLAYMRTFTTDHVARIDTSGQLIQPTIDELTAGITQLHATAVSQLDLQVRWAP